MKKLSFLLFLTLLAVVFVSSCSDSKTYAELLKEEEDLVKDYIKRNNIKVLSEFPADSVFAENEYLLTKSGLYYRTKYQGDTSTKLQAGTVITPRYYQYTLGLKPDTVSRWSTLDVAYPETFILGDKTTSCIAFHEAATYMKYFESECEMIVPSKMGFNSYMLSVTPLRYRLKIRFK